MSSSTMNLSETVWNGMRREWLNLIDAAESRVGHCMAQLTDQQIWWRPFPGSNSIANQLIHVSGNLRQWIVDGIRQQHSQRDRAAEFNVDGGLSIQDVTTLFADTLKAVRTVLMQTSLEMLPEMRTIQDFHVTVQGALAHSIPHLVGHTHQIVLLTRLILKDQYRFHWTPDADRSIVPL